MIELGENVRTGPFSAGGRGSGRCLGFAVAPKAELLPSQASASLVAWKYQGHKVRCLELTRLGGGSMTILWYLAEIFLVYPTAHTESLLQQSPLKLLQSTHTSLPSGFWRLHLHVILAYPVEKAIGTKEELKGRAQSLPVSSSLSPGTGITSK